MEHHYQCVVKSAEWTHTVNVFTKSTDPKLIAKFAVDRVIQNNKDLGIETNRDELTPISYKKMPVYILS